MKKRTQYKKQVRHNDTTNHVTRDKKKGRLETLNKRQQTKYIRQLYKEIKDRNTKRKKQNTRYKEKRIYD